MKKITLLLILTLSFILFHSPAAKAQNVYIPDSMFKKILVNNLKINTNGDTAIQVSETTTYTGAIFVSNSNINDMTGIEAFTAITTLDCSYNKLTSLNITANTALTYLDCRFNQLTSINLTANKALTYLDCGINYLTSLNVLANTALTYLECSDNQLTSLNVSANTALTSLRCDYNQLTSLNVTANTALVELYCTHNPLLTSLNVSANTALTKLFCYVNQLDSLNISANTALIELYCSSNQLTNLDVSANTALKYLNCTDNQLTNLDVSAFTAITTLDCSYNKLTSLDVSANTALKNLDCGNNQLTSLNISANTALTYLSCHYNKLSSLDVSANTALTGLDCSANQLTNLDVSANTALKVLDCSNNQLTTLSQVPNVMFSFLIYNNNINCLSNLPQVNGTNSAISNNPLTCVPIQTNYSLGLPLCVEGDTTNNPSNCQSVTNITGKVYTDMNGNCTYNITDSVIENIPVKLYNKQNKLLAVSYTIKGVYSFAALQPDSFKVKINDAVLPIAMACGQANTQTVHLDSTKQTIANINFPVVCDSAFDMQVHAVTRQGWVFPGQVHTLNTNLANDVTWYNLYCGSKTYSGTVTIHVNGPVTYVAPVVGALTPQVSGNTFTYAISDFNTLTPKSFGLKLLTDTTAQSGNKICVHVSIKTTPTDADTTNNTYDFCYNVTNSYDPNLKEVYPTDVLPGYNDWFTYTIHFQNTGNAPAFNIRLRDTLDTQLDLNTFEFLGASHTATTSLNNRILSVRFNNIMLPDSTSNHDGSMGYYQYRVKPLSNLLKGSNIKNTAYIYFDYNPAIVTNTTENHFDITTGVNSTLPQASRLWLYPNPSTGIFTFNETRNLEKVEVYTVFGELILSQGNSKQINLHAYPKGVYFAKVNGVSVVKLVKE